MSYKIMIHPMPESCVECPLYLDCDQNECPLIPAEPWQFETCKTCGTPWNECVVDGIINELSYEATCKLWTAKPAKNGEQNETVHNN